MGGADTSRGITYQHTWALLAALDVVADPLARELRLEYSEDVVDFEVIRSDGRRLRVAQVKSRIEPNGITSTDLQDVLRRWSELDAPSDKYEFLTDSHLTHPAVRLRNELDRLQLAVDTASAPPLLSDALTAFPRSLLERVRIASRSGDTNTLLSLAEARLITLTRTASASAVEDRINALLRIVAVSSGAPERHGRVLSRAALARVLGVDLSALAVRVGWAAEIAAEYRRRLSAIPQTGVVLTVLLDRSNRDETLGADPDDLSMPVDRIVPAYRRCLLEGPSGAGKSTSLQQLVHRLASTGWLPVTLSPRRYVGGTLRQHVLAGLEETLQMSLAETAVDQALDDPRAVLLVDGLTERPIEERNALRNDILEIARPRQSLAMVITGRAADSFRLPGVPLLRLQALSHEARVTIAAASETSVAVRPETVTHIERDLGPLALNPMLFSMALAMDRVGPGHATRSALYRGLVDRLWGRHLDDSPIDLAELVACRVARSMVDAEAFTASRREWLERAAAAISPGTAAGSWSADADRLVGVLESVGIIRTSGFDRQVAFIHDSFRDYFTSLSYESPSAGIPTSLSAAHHQSLHFFCERNGLSADLAVQLAEQAPISLYRLARLESSCIDPAVALRLARVLLSPLTAHTSLSLTDAIGVRVHFGRPMSWIAVTGSGNAVVVQPTDAVDHEVVSAVDGDAGPAILASRLWRTLLESAISSAVLPRSRWYSTRHRTPTELADALGLHAAAVDSAVRAILSTLPSAIAPALAAETPGGFYGQLLAAPGAQDAHDLRYRRDDRGVRIEVVDTYHSGELDWSYTSVEHVLHEEPKRAARSRLTNSLSRLLREGD